MKDDRSKTNLIISKDLLDSRDSNHPPMRLGAEKAFKDAIDLLKLFEHGVEAQVMEGVPEQGLAPGGRRAVKLVGGRSWLGLVKSREEARSVRKSRPAAPGKL